MFERNSLAATGCPTSWSAVFKPSGGGKLNRRNFGICSWRPDSETVASRAFAQTPAELEVFKGWHSASSADTFGVEDYSGIFLIALFSASAVFGPEGALSLG